MKKLVIAAVLGSLVVALPALAQGVNPSSFGAPQKPRGPEKKGDDAPPALPGSRAEPAAVAPASKVAADMPPTEALFDAINRGDLVTAKDSVNRGADLNGTNVLGLTPIELAVDLGRNQISFYLLSLRGGTAGSVPSGPPGAAPKPPSRAERLAADRAERAERTARTRNVAADARPVAPQTARLFSGDGGAPVPQAGFLGFDAGR